MKHQNENLWKKVLMVWIWLRKLVLHLKANDVSLITRGLMPRMSCELYKYFNPMMMIWSFHFNSTNIFDNTQCLPTDNDHDKQVYIFPALYVNILEMPFCHCLEFWKIINCPALRLRIFSSESILWDRIALCIAVLFYTRPPQ